MGKDPAEFWYKGELGFFDNYILPLAQKLRDCKVFGVSSDEVLNYAKLNRAEWEARGEEVVAGMVELREQKAAEGKLLGGHDSFHLAGIEEEMSEVEQVEEVFENESEVEQVEEVFENETYSDQISV